MKTQVVISVLDFIFMSLALDFLTLELKVPSKVVKFIEKLATTCARQPEGSFGIQAQLSRICHANSPSPSGRKGVHQRVSLGGQPLPAFIPPEPTGSWRMTNSLGIYLCRGTCRSEEVVGRAIGLIAGRCWPCLADVIGSDQDLREIT